MGGLNQKNRILCVYKILNNKSDEEHPISANYIINELSLLGYDVDRKTVYSDIEALNTFGVEVIHTDFPKRGYFLSDRIFQVSEISLLIDAVLSANFITPKKTEQLVSKLRGFLSIYQAQKINKNTHIGNRKKCDNEEIFYNIDTLKKSIDEGKKVSFDYYKYILKSGHFIQKVSKKMKVSPYALVWEDDHYYLVCNNEKYDNLMHLRLDKISKVTKSNEISRHFSQVSEYREEFNVSDYASKTFNMFSGTEETVTLRCKTDILNIVVDKFGNDIFVRSSDNDCFVFDSKVYISNGLIHWLLSFGNEIEVIKPIHLREKMKASIKETAENYSK